ncbi:hypothetical protein [Variovorax sp. OV084]|uniref:hypothetical protein n=1 Tax=Variovorax sp. OV084 TaxID=1882777 RepID=UPI0008CA8893|nr:hypothetical protein [Variovorax sp. OV084]SET02265.1 hypothetical protein SAMN05443580_1011237 [Variovorax sp. OV084]
MTWLNLLPSLVLLALWLLKNLVDTRLQKGVQNEYDTKLAAMNSELRKAEERFRADLKSKELEIQALQSSLLAGIASRRALTDKRQIDAIDQLWEAMHRLGSARVAAQWMAAMKFEPVMKEAARNEQFRKVFEAIKLPDDALAEAFALAAKARPHVSPLSWAYFAAWQSVVVHSAAQLKLIQTGLDLPNLMDSTRMTNAVKLALPHHAAYIDKYGSGGGYHLLDELEDKLLTELQVSLEGKTHDAASMQRARRILEEANRGASVPPPEVQRLGQGVPPP